MRCHHARMSTVALSAALLALPCLCRAQVRGLDIPESRLRGRLSDDDRDRIREAIGDLVGDMADAETAEEVYEARNALTDLRNDLDLYREPSRLFASTAAEELLKLIQNPREKLTRLKEVNACMAITSLRRPAAATAYRAMLSHASGAVRHFGWDGCRWVAIDVVAGDGDAGPGFLSKIGEAAKAESSPIVAEQMFRMLAAPNTPMADIPEEERLAARRELLGAMEPAWRTWCRRVLRGSVEAARSCETALPGLRASYARFEGDEATRSKILQMLADLLWASSEAYRTAGADGAVAEANARVLEAVETRLNELLGSDRTSVSNPLGSGTMEPDAKAKAVRRAALEWIELHLSGMDVKNPRDRLVEPTPTPSTGPAEEGDGPESGDESDE